MNKITLNPRHILLSLAFGLAAIANTAFAQTPGGERYQGKYLTKMDCPCQEYLSR